MDAFWPGIVIFSHPFPNGCGDSHALLLQAATRYTGLSSGELGTLETNPWGKPRFSAHPDLHFSITHSGNWWLCAFSGYPLGLDLQIHRAQVNLETFSRRFFHPRENAFLALDGYRRFFDLWCAKESWVKYTGQGFYGGTESFSVVSETGEFPTVDEAQMQFLPFADGYSLCICSHLLGSVYFFDLNANN